MTLKQVSEERAEAWIDGTRVSLDEAVAEAARLLAASAQPLIAGLGADVDGARLAVALAEQVGGVIDHTHSAAILRDLDSLRETGVMVTTPGEARMRADVLVMVGDGLDDAWPALRDTLMSAPPRSERLDERRRLVALARNEEPQCWGNAPVETVLLGKGAGFAANLAALRAAVRGRRLATARDHAPDLDLIAGVLKRARFGVAVWSASRFDALEVEMLNGLVRDLNETTRFSTLPLAADDNGAGVLTVCGWMTGFPMRTGFGAGSPLHDPWRFDAERLVRTGETDCVLYISAFGAPPPEWGVGAVSIALCDRAVRLADTPKVRIEVGRPGVDHDAVLHSPDAGTLVAVGASSRSASAPPSVAEALARIARRLPNAGALAC